LTGKPEEIGRKICLTGTLPTLNPMWTERDANPGLRGEKPATNRLSYGTAVLKGLFSTVSDYSISRRER